VPRLRNGCRWNRRRLRVLRATPQQLQQQARRRSSRSLRRCHACWRGPRLLAGLVVQSGIVPDVRQAEAIQAKFAAEGIPASIEVRLQLGPFRTRAEAEVARQKIKGVGIDGLITVGKVSKP